MAAGALRTGKNPHGPAALRVAESPHIAPRSGRTGDFG